MNYALFTLSILLILSSFTPFAASFAQGPKVDMGGAFRLNYAWKDYGEDDNGSFDFELFRIDTKIEQGDLFLDAQYRWYQEFDTVHHLELGYIYDKNNTFLVGLTQVPFGIEPWASHSFWFGGTYYLGLEDDYDMGVKWQHKFGPFTLDTAYFFNSEYDNADHWKRYSFDVSAGYDNQRANREDGQINTRLQYKWGKHTLGTSLQYGQFTNDKSSDSGDHYAAAFHFDGYFKNDWKLQLQVIKYEYDAEETLETADHRITLSAFEAPFEIASSALVSSVNLAKSFRINKKWLDTITCYNDYTYIAAADEVGLTDSIQNVTGCAFSKGAIYTYVDWIAGKNMWFVGGDGVGINDGTDSWHSRLNINFGIYY
ncbi:hypothetical protein HR060_14310 [Catenovulum sp. SM1970]|uniref:hypothetical protein n=1 Tax=Marinifaba aquimaris TaxID=2741323 RepID=UPI0015716025|nr:hypothetical protein [Marinifaba aquimaris]NTS78029.1 hypothetical protein [Marinifaba aquimaris]